ncbi:MAG: Enoyl-CoA hydratase/isomerase [Deltaproteobacteria bacterium]|nr:Enoyl-CoA hydratase/isomerase [Deltaproteobacteria bacterium]
MSDSVLFEQQGAIGVVTLNRPESLNAISADLIEGVRTVVARVAVDRSVRALVLTGAGRAFCAGADLSPTMFETFGIVEGTGGDQTAQMMERAFNPMMREIYRLEKPTVAAVNGMVAGGGVGVALVCDIVLAARSAKFYLPFGPRLGIVPDLCSSWMLARNIGRARTLGLALLGDKIPAEQAEQWGLIWRCVDDTRLMEESLGVAQRLADGPTEALVWTRRAIDAADFNNYEEQLDYEREAQRVLGNRPTVAEGFLAFHEKRKPRFHED